MYWMYWNTLSLTYNFFIAVLFPVMFEGYETIKDFFSALVASSLYQLLFAKDISYFSYNCFLKLMSKQLKIDWPNDLFYLP